VFAQRDRWLRTLAARHRIDVPSLVADRRLGDAPSQQHEDEAVFATAASHAEQLEPEAAV
jgi:hypothetical protein